ncbi:hypothetical protein TNCV_1714141 [Trichonephila clavipes]|nr:hypothetical protein TNCV_1714141 [Trichonephila clavipes]
MENLSDQSFIPTKLGCVDEEMKPPGRRVSQGFECNFIPSNLYEIGKFKLPYVTFTEHNCKDLLPAPGNRSNETHDIERKTWQREERRGRKEGEKESGSEKEVVGKKKIRLDDVL